MIILAFGLSIFCLQESVCTRATGSDRAARRTRPFGHLGLRAGQRDHGARDGGRRGGRRQRAHLRGRHHTSHGYRLSEASRAAPFEYSTMPPSVLWGYVFFQYVPSLQTLAGAAIVVFGGLYALRLDRADTRRTLSVALEGEERSP